MTALIVDGIAGGKYSPNSAIFAYMIFTTQGSLFTRCLRQELKFDTGHLIHRVHLYYDLPTIGQILDLVPHTQCLLVSPGKSPYMMTLLKLPRLKGFI